jgi:hypothetical protein
MYSAAGSRGFEGTTGMDGTIGMGGLGLSENEDGRRKFNLLTNRSHAWPATVKFSVSTTLIPIPNHDRRRHIKSEKEAKQAEHY